MPEFGTALRQVRQSLGLSQGELAARLASTQRHISFLETGRSEPSRQMLGRLATDLALNASQRTALFEASPFKSPYPKRDLNSAEIVAALDMLQARALAHWPFPAFVMAGDWTILRSNTGGERMLAMLGALPDDTPPNLLVMLTSKPMRAMITNWAEASTMLYFRLQRHAAHNGEIKTHLDQLRREGVFDHVNSVLTQSQSTELITPLKLTLPNGASIRTTSLIAKLGTVHDATIEGLEVELLMPVDEISQTIMLGMAA